MSCCAVPMNGLSLSLPAIAEQDEEIPIGNGQIHCRHAGDVLHPEREPREVLESLRAQLGAEIFAAQYQQQPVPARRRHDQARLGPPL